MWIPLKKFIEDRGEGNWPSLAALRYIIWRGEAVCGKGSFPFLKRFGSKVLIDPEKWDYWLDSEEAAKTRKLWAEDIKSKRKAKKEKV